MESYSRGRRGVPAKDVGVERRARVQIPHSPPIAWKESFDTNKTGLSIFYCVCK